MYTNKTPNFDLPQWIATDTPTFLGDLNGAFSDIDTALHTANTLSESANTNATNAITEVTQLTDIVGENTTDITGLKTTQVTQGNSLNTLTETVNNLTGIYQDQQNLITSLGNYLSEFNPSLLSNAIYRVFKIGSLKFLNIYGTIQIQYTGTPSLNDIQNIEILEINPNLKQVVEVNNTPRNITNIGQISFTESTNDFYNFPIGYRSNNNSLYKVGAQNTGTVRGNSSVYLFIQGWFFISDNNPI